MKEYLAISIIILLICLYKDSDLSARIQGHANPERMQNMKNTRWEIKDSDGCINYIFLKKTAYNSFVCGFDFPRSGKYYIKNDTLILTEIDLVSDLPGNNKYGVTAETKWILIGKKLILLLRKDLGYTKWVSVDPKGTRGYSLVRKY
ncbi:hypothetical protein ACXZ1K_11480 [Pedobacter sp. PWIIR3]